MQAKVYSNDLLIGMTDFSSNVGSMGHIFGVFTPTGNYALIKPRVQAFTVDPDRNFPGWYSLRLNVQLENGYFIFPVGGYEIMDHPEFQEEPIEIHLAGINTPMYTDYVLPYDNFLPASWTTLIIQQKIEYEDIIETRFGPTNARFSALGRHSLSGDILFEIMGVPGYSFAKSTQLDIPRGTLESVFPPGNYYREYGDFYTH